LKSTTDDLEAHLQNIDDKLEAIFSRTVGESGSDTAELQLMKEERMSAQKCLQICAQLSDHIDQIQVVPEVPDTVPERLINEGLLECKKLESYMKDRIDLLVAKSKTTMTSQDDLTDLMRLQEEWETTRQSRNICSKAEIHLKENITTIDNYATGDAVQFLVSTNGTIIHGKNRGLGWRTRQIGGHLSDATVQQISRDMSSMHSQRNGNETPSSRVTVLNNESGNEPGSEFKERYGPGFKLAPKTTTLPGESRISSSPKA